MDVVELLQTPRFTLLVCIYESDAREAQRRTATGNLKVER
jgi:hypothetical protein